MSQPNTPFKTSDTKPLGRGLDSLFGNSPNIPASATKEDGLTTLSINALRPGKYQPRLTFSEADMQELTDSVREKGVLQPILVRSTDETDSLGNTVFEIIAGERRWRAAKAANLSRVPVVIRNFTDLQALETGLIENVQRHDLNPLEEGKGYQKLIEEFKYTQEQLSRVIGKSRSHIANTLRLLTLSEKIQNMLLEGKITAGHARALLGCTNADEMVDKIIADNLSVRETERLVAHKSFLNQYKNGSDGSYVSAAKPHNNSENLNHDIQLIEENFSKAFGLKTKLYLRDNGQGELRIFFDQNTDLDAILNRIFSAL